jgi:hypothetical protein
VRLQQTSLIFLPRLLGFIILILAILGKNI